MNHGKNLKYFIKCLFAVLILTACSGPKTISRNYRFVEKYSCDCYTKHPLLLVGAKSQYYSKETGFCTKSDFAMRRDSIIKLEKLRYHTEETLEAHSPGEGDSIRREIDLIDEQMLALKSGWTHLKVKTKWRVSGESFVILKQKTKFYNKFKSGRKLLGMKIYTNDSLI